MKTESVKGSQVQAAADRLKVQFREADANGDGAVYATEIRSSSEATHAEKVFFLDQLQSGGTARPQLSVKTMDSWVDAAVKGLEKADRNRNGRITGSEVLRTQSPAQRALWAIASAMAETPVVSPLRAGESFYELRQHCDELEKTTYSSPSQVPAELAQPIIVAANESTYSSTTLADVFSQVDASEVVVRRLLEKDSGQELLAIDYGAGDSTYGAIFDPQSRKKLAGIHDNDIYLS